MKCGTVVHLTYFSNKSERTSKFDRQMQNVDVDYLNIFWLALEFSKMLIIYEEDTEEWPNLIKFCTWLSLIYILLPPRLGLYRPLRPLYMGGPIYPIRYMAGRSIETYETSKCPPLRQRKYHLTILDWCQNYVLGLFSAQKANLFSLKTFFNQKCIYSTKFSEFQGSIYC